MKLPSREAAIFKESAADLDYSRRPEIGPGEFFFLRPDQFDGLAGALGQTCGFNRNFAGMFSAVSGAGIGDDDSHVALRDAECFGQLTSYAEGHLCAGPNHQLSIVPFRDSCARFNRRVRYVGQRVGGFAHNIGRLETCRLQICSQHFAKSIRGSREEHQERTLLVVGR